MLNRVKKKFKDMCSYAKKLALFLNEMNLITCYGSPCKSGQTDKLVRNIYSSIIKSPPQCKQRDTDTLTIFLAWDAFR